MPYTTFLEIQVNVSVKSKELPGPFMCEVEQLATDMQCLGLQELVPLFTGTGTWVYRNRYLGLQEPVPAWDRYLR